MSNFEVIGNSGLRFRQGVTYFRWERKKLSIPNLRCPHCGNIGTICLMRVDEMMVEYTPYRIKFPRELYFTTQCHKCNTFVDFAYVERYLGSVALNATIYAIFSRPDYYEDRDEVSRDHGDKTTEVRIASRRVSGLVDAVSFSNGPFRVSSPPLGYSVTSNSSRSYLTRPDVWRLSGIKIVLTYGKFELSYEEECPYSWSDGNDIFYEEGRILVSD